MIRRRKYAQSFCLQDVSRKDGKCRSEAVYVPEWETDDRAHPGGL